MSEIVVLRSSFIMLKYNRKVLKDKKMSIPSFNRFREDFKRAVNACVGRVC